MHTPEYRQLLRQLVAAREAKGLTQREVARALGVPQSWVAKIEIGERRVDVIELLAFAKLYKRSLSWFLRQEKGRG